MSLIFWIFLGVIVYTFVGYGMLLFCLVRIKRIFKTEIKNPKTPPFPTCSVLIAAYNEEYFIRHKIKNTLALAYPPERMKIFIVTDGSTDRTIEIVKDYPEVILLHNDFRKGKIHAINRAMQYIDSEVVVFTDANTFLNKDALINISRNYNDPKVGGVAGEKQIYMEAETDASTAGESFYWRYESKLKLWDSELNTTIGAAGELFSIRRELYKHVPESTILDDFVISMRIAERGFKIVYEPKAYAIETSSACIKEELKRKIRIAAGGMQAIILLKSLLNPFKHPLLSFQYISHRVLRWTITPFLLMFVLPLNFLLITTKDANLIYKGLFTAQIMFYFLAILGLILERKNLKFKIAFIPYYFCVMNYSVIKGISNYFRSKQKATWDKSERKNLIKVRDLFSKPV